MKNILLITTAFTLNAFYASAQVKPQNAVDQKVNSLLAKMTLEEKVGQMTNLVVDVISKTDASGKIIEPHEIDEQKLEERILKYHIGSFQNVAGHAYDRKHWYEIISAIQHVAMQDRLKIPALYGIDAIHGVSYTLSSTLFPQEIGMAATYNPELIHEAGEISAYETRASYIPWNFSPVLDVAKNQAWPRIYETFGEDPYLVKTMGAAIINGYQGDNVGDKYHVTSTMKHFLGYGDPLSGKDRTPAWIPDRYMREYFLPPFVEAIKTGSRTLMVNSSEINGVPVHSSKYLLTDVLCKELKFDGIVISDWMDVSYLHTRHHVAATEKDAVALAVNAGLDMCIVSYDYSFYNYLIQLVHEGRVPMSRIDESVRRILHVKYELGLFDRPVGNNERIGVVLEYIRENYIQKISLSEVANIVSMTEEGFSRFFSRVMRKTFVSYLNEYRINRACTQLVETDKQISTICYESGYDTQPFFFKQFRKFKNCSPREYRDNYLRTGE